MLLSMALAYCLSPFPFNTSNLAPPELKDLATATIDLSDVFAERDAAFVLVDEKTRTVQRFNAQRCQTRLGPCSTFKVPHALIGLELGVLADENHPFKWDGKKRWRAALNQDHTLSTAVRDSVPWYFKKVATQIGADRMRDHLKKLHYGNRDISSGIDEFWLNQSLKISADEQVAFLRKLRGGHLPYSQRAQKITRDVITLESNETYTLAGKTGTAASADGERMILGWFVGYIERGDDAYVFACNMRGNDNASGWEVKKLVLKALRQQGILPDETSRRVSKSESADTP